jgi:hypothetical protein
VSNVPISPDRLREIAAFVAEDDDLKVKLILQERLIRIAQKEANEDALNRKRYRKAIEEAHLEGYADPEGYARAVVGKLKLIDLHESRVRAMFRRVEARNTKGRDKLAAKLETASKTANPSIRRLPEVDRQYVEIIGEAEKEGTLSNVPSVPSKLNSKIPGYHLPHWEKTTTVLKIMAMSLESSREGAQTINLLLNPSVCEKALRSPKGPATYIQHRIRVAFKKAFNGEIPDFWFVIETDTDQRFHVHGAVVTPNVPDAVKKVDDGLRVAGGVWDNPAGGQKQQLSTSLDHPIGWASYICKRMNKGKTRIETKLFGSTLPIRRRAEAGWDALRAALPQSPRRP